MINVHEVVETNGLVPDCDTDDPKQGVSPHMSLMPQIRVGRQSSLGNLAAFVFGIFVYG